MRGGGPGGQLAALYDEWERAAEANPD